ncbi:MAG: protein rep [Limnothrix sp. RL_2_0]|nr:protein rep [Limnothrix sp. RL_2_0]
MLTSNLISEQGSNSSYLCDLSPKDKSWDKHRSTADSVQNHYFHSQDFQKYARRVSECSQLLEFGIVPNNAAKRKLKLTGARFCRVRHCPVCQWRRSLMWKSKAYKVLPKIVEQYPKHRWLFLTLTLRNCSVSDLRVVLQEMNKAFKRMTMRKVWSSIGWLKSIEVTCGRDGSAHPHFHCLLMVPPTYFGKNYMKQADWVDLWRSCMKLDYNPIVDVRAVKRGQQPMQLIPEILKYCTKESDMVGDRDWFLELTRQMHKLRCVATGGLLKNYLRELEQEPDDLIGADELGEGLAGELYFGWQCHVKRYKQVDI